jgi:diguanylate cyclase (GGDEF)-like protein
LRHLKATGQFVDVPAVTQSNSKTGNGLLADIRDVVLVTSNGRVCDVHGPFESLFGFDRAATLKAPLADLLSNIDGDYEPLLAEATKRRGDAVFSAIRLLAGTAKTRWVEVAIREVPLGRNALFQQRRGHVVSIRDRTAETELRLQISRLAASDPVTDLANPVRFRELLNAAMHRSRRTGEHLAVLSIRISTMEAIRAVYDPADVAAIQLELAKRVSNTLRIEDVVGHIDADEFGVVLSGMEPKIGRAYAVDVADRIGGKLAEPVDVGGNTTTVVASIGIAHGTRGKVERTAADLINDARSARQEVEANADRWRNLKNPS